MFTTHPDVETRHGASLQCLFVALFFQNGISINLYFCVNRWYTFITSSALLIPFTRM
jgi:hypothetical protein